MSAGISDHSREDKELVWSTCCLRRKGILQILLQDKNKHHHGVHSFLDTTWQWVMGIYLAAHSIYMRVVTSTDGRFATVLSVVASPDYTIKAMRYSTMKNCLVHLRLYDDRMGRLQLQRLQRRVYCCQYSILKHNLARIMSSMLVSLIGATECTLHKQRIYKTINWYAPDATINKVLPT